MSEPIVFIHAFPLDRRMWQAQLDEASRRNRRAVVVDLRGFGDARGELASTMDGLAAGVVHTLDAHGIDRAILAGLSLGGYVALAMQRLYPQRIAGLVLADTRAGADSEEGKRARNANIELARTKGSAAVYDAMAGKLFASGTAVSVRDAVRAIAASQDPEAVVAALEAMRDRPDSSGILASIAVPTRIIVGRSDEITPLAESQKMHDTIRGSTLHVIDNAGHLSNLEQPAAFNDALFAL
jgi:3-oxoadipate enol-lactonase